jgi:AraC family transcriptional regulator
MARNARMKSANFVLHEKARDYYWRGSGLLSIKSFYNGRAFYNIGKGAFVVDDLSYLILNHEQEYEIFIDSEREVTSFCVFFARGFAEDIARNFSEDPESLLDDPIAQDLAPLSFFQRTYNHDLRLSPLLKHIRDSHMLHKNDPGWSEEQFHRLMQKLLLVHLRTKQETQVLSAIRHATREELYRRLHLARDYLVASYNQPVTLDDLAAIACMTPNHLLRTFKQVFGQTPHQYLISERLRQARHLLVMTDKTVTEICMEIGFDSLGSFSWLFRQRFGISPQAFRKLNS